MLYRRIAWITALVLLFSAVVYRVAWSANAPGQGAGIGVVFSVMLVFGAALLGILVGLVVAVFPGKGTPYARRLWLRLPFVLLLICGCGALAAVFPEWWESQHGMKLLQGASYGSVPTALDPDCLAVHDGVFENDGLYLERHGAEQFQRDKVLGQEERVSVVWLSPCEYELCADDSLLTRRVKILRADSTGYDCVVRYANDTTFAFTIRLHRVR